MATTMQSLGKAAYVGADFQSNDGGLVGPSESLGISWRRGVHMEDNELEEGEACDDLDSNCNPDTDFSYIDEKLRVVLGDVQKEFEGGVSAEKLGSKFGGYGSFLPTHERAPSLFLESTLVNDLSQAKRSLDEGVVERIKRTATSVTTAVATERAGNSVGPSSPGEGNKFIGRIGTGKGSASTVSNNDKKRFTLKIRMGSDGDVRRKSMTVYSELGLEDDSSASLEDDEDDQRSVSDIESSPDRSPLGMIRIMTSHEVPGGRLLSPLLDSALDPFVYKEKVASCDKEEHLIGLHTVSRSECPLEIETESSRDIGVPIERKEKTKSKEKINSWKDGNVGNASIFSTENETGSDQSKRSRRDASEKRSGKGISQNVLKLSAKGSVKDKPIKTQYEIFNKDPLNKSGKGTNSEDLSHRYVDGALDRMDKNVVSDLGKESMLYDTNRESGRLSMKDKCSSSDCTKLAVKSEPIDRGSPFNTFREVEVNNDVPRRPRGDRESVEESTKERFDMLNQARDRRNDAGLADVVANSRKQQTVSKGLSEKHTSHETWELHSALKDKVVINRETKQHIYSDNEVSQMPEFDTSGAVRDTTKDSRSDYRISMTEGKLLREQSKVKDSSAGVWKERKRDLSSKEFLPKEDNDDTLQNHKMKVRESHKDVAKDTIKKDVLERRKKEKIKEERTSDLNAKGSLKYERDGEREKVFVKHKTEKVNAAGPLASKNLTEALPDKHLAPVNPIGIPATDRAPNCAVPAPVVILEDWVLCDKCEQWRLLPPGIQPDQLPKKWRCKMLNWLPGMNSCKYPEDETTKALYVLLGIAQPPAQVQVDPILAHIPASTISSTAPAGEMNPGISDVNKSKKTCKVELDSTKNEIRSDDGLVPQERKVIPGGDSLGYARTMEKMNRMKEKEKKRPRTNDGEEERPRKHVVQEENHFQSSPLRFDGDSSKKRKEHSGIRKEEKHSKKTSIDSKKLPYMGNTKHQAKSSYGHAQASNMAVNAEVNMISRPGPLNQSVGTTSTDVGKLAKDDSRQPKNRGKLQNIVPVGESLARIDAQQSSSGESAGHFKGNNITDSAILDSCVGESSKKRKECGSTIDGTSRGRDGLVGTEFGVASPVKRGNGYITATSIIQEAKDMKHRADRLRGRGLERESTNLYFSAALKFLHAAAMLEPAHAESIKSGENTPSMLFYADTANLCEYCATSYERAKELAAAALAYKCVGIARMRVILAKCGSANRDRDELQGACQLFPHGDSSSSSSASGVDNIISQTHDKEKINFSRAKGAASPSLPQSGGNYVIASQLRPNLGRLFHFVSDITSALEAFDKSQTAYAAADAYSASTTYGMEGMIAVKNVVDFGFHDIESLLRLVRLALEAIGH